MIVAVDVDYRAHETVAAAVAFEAWPAATATHELVERLPPAAPYVSGELWRRELPALLAVLAAVDAAIAPRTVGTIVVDAYVWLPDGTPGLGARLHAARGACPVVGVAKTALHGDALSIPVLRGTSARPLFVTAVGIDARLAAAAIAAMHGPDRTPTLLRRVDRCCRDA